MAKEGDIGLNACSEMPCFLFACFKEDGGHGVAIHDGETIAGRFDKEASVAITIKGNPDQLPRFSLWKCADKGVL